MTDFIETRFLLALLDGNIEEANRLASTMLPGERNTLYEALEQGQSILEDYDS